LSHGVMDKTPVVESHLTEVAPTDMAPHLADSPELDVRVEADICEAHRAVTNTALEGDEGQEHLDLRPIDIPIRGPFVPPHKTVVIPVMKDAFAQTTPFQFRPRALKAEGQPQARTNHIDCEPIGIDIFEIVEIATAGDLLAKLWNREWY